jgi:hypothetical protein
MIGGFTNNNMMN